MNYRFCCLTTLLCACWLCSWSATQAPAVGVVFQDPGWFYAYDGDEAFYNDPDGPNPDYLGMNSNQPGGQGDTAALVFPGFTDPGCIDDCDVDNENAEWFHKSQNWDGSAPGDALGGTPGGDPPIPPPAPGGVGAFTEGETTFLRLQDTGDPSSWGFPDKGQSASEGFARQEGSNRKIQFAHEMTQDAMFSGAENVIDRGLTISFRTRLATAATGPLDDIYVEGGASASPGGAPVPWPEDGVGYQVANDGRGMFHITQTNPASGTPTGGQQMAFSLLDNDTITFNGLGITKTGLVMNNPSNVSMDVDTGGATDETVNIVEIPDEAGDRQLGDWHEFWITMEAINLSGDGVAVADGDGNTHVANVYHSGAADPLVPEEFKFILGPENEFGAGSHLGLGLSSGSRLGAYDVDFYAYLEGTMAPELADGVVVGDMNGDGEVNFGDLSPFALGLTDVSAYDAAFPELADTRVERGDVSADAAFNFGDLSPFVDLLTSGVGSGSAAVPEPGTLMLATLAGLVLVGVRRRTGSIG